MSDVVSRRENEQWEGEYPPSHPWFYKFNPPLSPESITPAEMKGIKLDKKDIGKAKESLDSSIRRYAELVEKGESALSDWDRKDPMGLFTALSLVHNHIAYFKGMIRLVKSETEIEPWLFPDMQ